MHRPLPCQDVVLASYMQITGGHLLPQDMKKAPFAVNDAVGISCEKSFYHLFLIPLLAVPLTSSW